MKATLLWIVIVCTVVSVAMAQHKCQFNGNEYNTFEVFSKADNCNVCRCFSDNEVKCSEWSCTHTVILPPLVLLQ
ncbi:hypothetical protein DPMN_127387 [Dreissena polymorpha]|uniref:Pacifastin domain-containing protein n=1 Tax=Dreissena polymorpha TaxID=45954 RepID=A0A9D4H159_DREPO|nr:hypothetical protein DPMN_127387 [Dreissena polymorpha]